MLAATTNSAMLTPSSWGPRSSAIAAGEELYATTLGDFDAREIYSIHMMRRAGQSGGMCFGNVGSGGSIV